MSDTFQGFSFPKPDATTPAAAEVPEDVADGPVRHDDPRPGAAQGRAIAEAEERRVRAEAIEEGWPGAPLGDAAGDCLCPDMATLNPDCPQHGTKPLPGVGPLEEALRAAEGWTGENPQLYADPMPIEDASKYTRGGKVPIVADHPNADTPTNVFAATVAREAVDLFTGPRVNDYGDATDNFQDIADLWSVVLRPLLKPGARITAEQAALCQAQIKIARLNNTPDHDDSWVDATAYLALGGGINRRRRA